MRTQEEHVGENSYVYVNVPTEEAKQLFFYPLHMGHYYYEPGYRLERSSLDSFLIMYIAEGSMTVSQSGKTYTVSKGEFALLDCYAPHSYYTDTATECIWLHFDGVLARPYYEYIKTKHEDIITIMSTILTVERMSRLIDSYASRETINEAYSSKLINDILTYFIFEDGSTALASDKKALVERAKAFIRDNYTTDISLDFLSSYAGLSKSHFIRVFTKYAGMTPHQYVTSVRMQAASMLLRATSLQITDISERVGYKNIAVFCIGFRKWFGMTPNDYRRSGNEELIRKLDENGIHGVIDIDEAVRTAQDLPVKPAKAAAPDKE